MDAAAVVLRLGLNQISLLPQLQLCAEYSGFSRVSFQRHSLQLPHLILKLSEKHLRVDVPACMENTRNTYCVIRVTILFSTQISYGCFSPCGG